MKLTFSKIQNSSLAKFLIVGGLSTILNYLCFYALINLYVDYRISSALGYISGLIFGMYLNKNWSFESQQSLLKITPSYLTVYFVSLGTSLLFLNFLVESLNIPESISNIGAIGLSTVMNFIGLKLFVFKKAVPHAG
jgi:putative flippase GtrA